MRIAISGSHCCGKTTLIEEFLLAHPEYSHEPEPYEALQDDYGELFSADPTAADFYRQLEFNLARLRAYLPGDNVIYERSPVDFLAYMLALRDLRRDDDAGKLAQITLGIVNDAVSLLDLIVFLTIGDMNSVGVPEDEDPKLRRAVDSQLIRILCDDQFDLFGSGHPVVVETIGTTCKRLRTLEDALDQMVTKRVLTK